MFFKQIQWVVLATVLTGCCSAHLEPKEILSRKNQEFVRTTAELYEVSLGLWEAMDKVEHTNHENLDRVLKEIGYRGLPEADEMFSRRAKMRQTSRDISAQLFDEIRRNMDPIADILFYYRIVDDQNASKSSDGILVTRHGIIRHRIVLSGDGALVPRTSK